MNSENSGTSDPHRLLLNLSDKINLKRSDKLPYQILAFTIHEKKKKKSYKIINFKYQLRHGVNSLNYLMDHILYQIFKIIFNIS